MDGLNPAATLFVDPYRRMVRRASVHDRFLSAPVMRLAQQEMQKDGTPQVEPSRRLRHRRITPFLIPWNANRRITGPRGRNQLAVLKA